ncbi:MAG: hypothetical protein QOI64_1857 [Solirubrobacteraceae bacterium]|nr:hypothetical protein [Solirubrobacteraceae bacterium]
MLHPATFVEFVTRSEGRPSGRRRSRPAGRPVSDQPAMLIRRASAADAPALARLSALDERELPAGEQLIGELGGRVVAALEVCSGRAIADPFVPTTGVVELLGLRAAQVRP